jgi:VWFA-related protein
VRERRVLQDVSFARTEKLPPERDPRARREAPACPASLSRHLQAAGRTLLGRLEPEDRAALVTFSQEVTLRQALTREADLVGSALARIEPRGESAVFDGSYAAVMLGDTDVGRDLVIVFSDGVDTASWLPRDRVLDAARRSDVVVYAVSVRSPQRPDFLRELSRLTGGSLLEVDSTRDVAPTFIRLLEEFRQRYLLSFVPQGVSTEGWHDLKVTVKRRRAVVNARAGYAASELAGGAAR